MPYLGRSPGSGVRTRFIYAATAGQTSFSGNDSNSVSLAYEDTLYMDVYQNGVLLKPVTDYAATTGTSVVLVTGATTDDVVEMIVYDTFAVADTVSAKDGGTFAGNIAVTGNVTTTGTVEPAGDTSAGDNAAIGFTSAEGLILTGQGSTSDITLKNDADATVFTVPTGTDDILFPDSAKAMFGAGSDLQIYHDGSNSYISEQGTNDLKVLATDFQLKNAADNEFMMTAVTDGAVTMYHNNSAKIATTSTGATVTGSLGIGTASPIALLTVVAADGVMADQYVAKFTNSEATTGQNYGVFVAGGSSSADESFGVRNFDSSATYLKVRGDGNVGIGTSSPDASLHAASDAANFVARFVNDGNNVNRLGIFVQTGTDDGSGTNVFFAAYDGNGDETGQLRSVSGTFQLTDTSDERLKQDIVDTTVSGLTSVNSMKVRDFAYKRNPTETIKAGFVAQELQTAFPSAVSYSESDDDKILSVSRERLVPVLVKAIQELSVKNDALEARITALEE